ncbi:MAG: ISL3 family transposase [Gammaproteobacteria bacterium]|nr:ISL3 family transposase [Gammaproteobacteria bacterium]
MPRNILNLSSYAIARIEEDEHDYHIWAEAAAHPSTCQRCGHGEVVGFGRREQLVRDLPMHGKRVGICVDTRRYRCRQCGKTFYERLPAVDERRMMTTRLIEWVGKQSVKRLFAHLAEEVGLAENTVKNVFRDYINELERTVRFEVPRWLGIDEIHIIRKPRCIISNIEHNTAVEVLPDRAKRTVMTYFQGLKGREKVRYVAMDMWNPYRESVQTLIPQATIVIDKFHVVRMANEALESVRKAQRAELSTRQRRGLMHDRFVLLKRRADLTDEEYLKLTGWTANYPALGAAYDAKEAFYGIWDMETRPEAERAYNVWKSGLTADMREAFHPLIRAVDNWHPHIFAYFDHRVTDAYTESLNNLIRVMNRLGRGYSFEALRAKILFSEGAHKVKRPSFQRCNQTPAMGDSMMESWDRMETFAQMSNDEPINYGAEISALVRMIGEGVI